MKRNLQEADFTRKTLIEKIAAFLQSVPPPGGTSVGRSMPYPVTPDVQACLIAEAPDTSPPTLPLLSRAHESVFASPIKRSLSMDSEEGEARRPGRSNCKGIQ